MTKPAVWVQFAVKENRVDGKNLLHLKHTTSQKLCFFFCTYKDFLSQIVLSCAQHMQLVWIPFILWQKWWFEIEEPWKIWKLICKAPNRWMIRELNVDLQVSFTLSLPQFYLLNEGITCVWFLSHDKIWYPSLTPLFLFGWNKKKMKFTELPNVDITNFGEKTASAIWNKQDHCP